MPRAHLKDFLWLAVRLLRVGSMDRSFAVLGCLQPVIVPVTDLPQRLANPSSWDVYNKDSRVMNGLLSSR